MLDVQEVRSADWDHFCELFTKELSGSLISMEQDDVGGAKKSLAKNVPLQAISLDKSGACNDILRIRAGKDSERIEHQVVEPIHFRIGKDANGGKVLAIAGEEGSIFIHFHSGKLNQLLEQFKAPATRAGTL